MDQQDDGLTNAEKNALKWLAVLDTFKKADDGCMCPPCRTIRLMVTVK
jgi:hypothetical protein